jgi:flagellar export protein FliJ
LAKFRFNLEVLLKHREDIEQKERDELLRIRYAYQVARGELEQLEIKRSQTMKDLALKQTEKADSRDMNWFYLYLNRLHTEIEELKKRLIELDSQVQAQKTVVIEATKKRKVLSILRSKRKKEFIRALDKKEQKEVDEWITARYAARAVDYH